MVRVPGEHERQRGAVSQHAEMGGDGYVAGRDIVINEGGQAALVALVHPAVDGWVASVHASPDDLEPLGCGVVLDERRVLTCGHVVEQLAHADGAASAWVGFPMAEMDASASARCRVERVVFPDSPAPVKDLAILVLAEAVPAGVPPAPLRCPRPAALAGKRWWAFGFPPGDPLALGSSADGHVESALAQGWVRLSKTSEYPVAGGFSGGGLWSPEYGAVVGVVAQADASTGNGRAISLYQAVQWFPGEDLRLLAEQFPATAAGEVALAAWGWSLAGDSEATRHWRPRARGVAIDSERGYRFRGRTAALRAITSWLERAEADRRVLVVTGAPGSGKSAVLGRIVTTADADAVRELPPSDAAMRASVGSVACAVHSKGLTALEVAGQIAKAASAALPERIEDFAPALRSALDERASSRFNVIIDALDEAASPAEARLIEAKVILPLAETCWDVGAQVVVGSRRSDADGDLLGTFRRAGGGGGWSGGAVSGETALGGAAKVVDLDEPEFFAAEDLAGYALATLQLAGDARAGNPYAPDAIAGPVAERIAALSDGNFLVAGLTARTHGLYDKAPVDPAALSFSPKVDDAMREYLVRIPPTGGVSAETLLTALAFAESPGMPVSLWRIAVRVLDSVDVPEVALRKFARSSAANFLIESSGSDDSGAEFRLFHQSLNDALRHVRAKLVEERDDEQSLARAFLAAGQEAGWGHAPGYLLRSLPGHAARGGLMDDLLADDDYLLYADLLRMQSLSDQATSVLGRERSRLLRLFPRDVLAADAPNRAAMFSVTETLEGLPSGRARAIRPPYQAVWAVAPQSVEHTVLQGHDGPANAVCELSAGGSVSHLVTAADDGTIRIWNPNTGTQILTLAGHNGAVLSVCTLNIGRATYLASSGDDGTIRIWNPRTGNPVHILTGHNGRVRSVCTLTARRSIYLASGGEDGTVRIWDPDTGTHVRTFTGHKDEVNAVCALTIGDTGTTLLATGSSDRTIRIWDPYRGGKSLRTLTGHSAGVNAVCSLTIGETTCLATASDDQNVRIWDPDTGGKSLRTLKGHTDRVNAVSPLTIGDAGTTLLATGSSDRTIRIWNPSKRTPLRTLTGHKSQVRSVCGLTIGGTTHLASASNDWTIRIWDPGTATGTRPNAGHTGEVNAVCTLTIDGTTRLATGSSDWKIRIWDPATGALLDTITGQNGGINAMCAVTIGGATYLATASSDRTTRIWDPAAGTRICTLAGHTERVNAVCTFARGDTIYLATASDDRTTRIWDASTGTRICTLVGHTDWVRAVCRLSSRLATASDDQTIRIWNGTTGAQMGIITGHTHWVRSACALAIGGIAHLATASEDRTVRIWNPWNRDQVRAFTGHNGPITAICTITLGRTTRLATASSDATVRIWDPARESSPPIVVPTRDPALAVAWDEELGLLFVGMETGILAIRPDAEFFRQSDR
jgi:WD40 repeat protein